jgi:hypothetical protein
MVDPRKVLCTLAALRLLGAAAALALPVVAIAQAQQAQPPIAKPPPSVARESGWKMAPTGR